MQRSTGVQLHDTAEIHILKKRRTPLLRLFPSPEILESYPTSAVSTSEVANENVALDTLVRGARELVSG